MNITIYTSNVIGNAQVSIYPNKHEVTSLDELMEAICYDQVFAKYKDNHRSNEGFISSNVIPQDCDNDHSEDPKDWVTMEQMSKMLSTVDHIIFPSRHNMLPKGNKAARPRFHVLLPINTITDASTYVALKKEIQKKYKVFDDNAVDAARFFFGCEVEKEDVIFHEGWQTIDEEVEVPLVVGIDEKVLNEPEGDSIKEGGRNNHMSRFAARILIRFGISDKAEEAFYEHAKKCDPPLPANELKLIWMSAVKFFKSKVERNADYVSPEEYEKVFGKIGDLKPEDYSDMGEAKVLVNEYGGELKYSEATDFLRYDGICWKESIPAAIGAIEEFMDLQMADALELVSVQKEALVKSGVDEKKVNAGAKELLKEELNEKQLPIAYLLLGAETYLKFVQKRRDYKNIVATANTAKPMIAIDVTDLDANEFLLNTPDGTVDLKTCEVKEHKASNLITKVTSCGMGNQGFDLWEEALNTFFCGDKELIDYVQQIVGMAVIGKVYHEHLIIAYGEGANGKSTFWNTIARVLGDYSGSLSSECLTTKYKNNVKAEMAELKGKRLVIAAETEEGVRLNTATVKKLCSTDPIQAEKKYKAPFAFVPSHTLVLYTNHLPKVGANDDGIWRRLVVIPFNAKITGKSDIKNYSDYLYKNAGLSILSWIVEGAKKAIEAEYEIAVPEVVKNAIDKYREDNDWLGDFIYEKCDVENQLVQKSGELYQAYRAYCAANGEYTRSTTDFYAALEKTGHQRKKTSKGVMVYGLKLKEGQEFLS